MIGNNISKFLSDTVALIENKVTTDILDISNESSKDGIRIVLELRKGADVERLKNLLYKKTKLEDTFGVNMLAIVDGRPETLDLKGIIENHTQFYYEVTRRKYKTLLSKLYEQREIKEGLIKACDMIDLIIEGAQNIGFGPIPMTIVMVAIIMISAIIMGSGAAPFYAFIALAPTVSESFGIHPVIMCLAMQLATGMGRNMSPISSCMVATAGCTDGKVLSVDLVKRTVIPMFVGAVGLILGDVIFFM